MDLYIGLDLGGSFLKYALGDDRGTLLTDGVRQSRAQSAAEDIFNNIFLAVEKLLEAALIHNGAVKGIGIGSPGVIDAERGTLLGQSPNLPHWADIEIAPTIERKFGVPAFADNDANIMTIAEMELGAGKGFRNAICLTVGTGIGGGLFIDGKLFRGSEYAGSELGHIVIESDGLPCPCGGRGCLEQYASAPAILRLYGEALAEEGRRVDGDLDVKDIFEKLTTGDNAAKKAIDRASEYLGVGIASLVNALNPEVIIIGGGVSNAGSVYIEKVAKIAHERAMANASKNLQVRKAEMGNQAGVIGALLYARKRIEQRETLN
jgi:glucokinase